MRKSALVIGGGIAGLAAALELIRQGVSVTVLEAKNRMGGRVQTIHEAGLPIELGAEFVHGRDPALLESIQRASLSLEPIAEGDLLFQNGSLKAERFGGIIDSVIGQINLREKDCSFHDFLDRQNLDGNARVLATGFVEGFEAADTRRISAQSLCQAQRAATQMGGDQQFRINEGYGALVQYFEREIYYRGGLLIKGAAARHIRWEKGGVIATVQQDNNFRVHKADVAIVTVSLGVLKAQKIEFAPSLPEKQEAVRALEFGNAVRISFLFRHKWWSGAGFIHAPDERLAAWWEDPRGPVLTGWAGGPKADALLELSKDQLEILGLEILGRIFCERSASIRAQLLMSFSWNWSQDPDIRGAYSYIPVNGLDLPKSLAAPVADTLYFAGEATVTDAQTGTVFGALESGQRAAKEVLATFGPSMAVPVLKTGRQTLPVHR